MVDTQKFISSDFISAISSWEVAAVIIFAAVVFLCGWVIGRNRLFTIFLSAYLSYILTLNIPWGKLPFLDIKTTTLPNYKIFIFFAGFLAIMFLLPQSGFGMSLRLHKRIGGGWFEIAALSILQAGFLISIVLSFLTNRMISDLNPLLRKYFIGEEIRFIWLSLPILVLMLLGRRRKEE